MRELLQLARSGDRAELERKLELETRATHATGTRFVQLTVDEQLLDEALWYVRHDDLSEAIYRLEQVGS